ncbi:MAG: hypothetical protein ACHQVS_04310 [Candidatus Babeliales bacterium]
MNIKIGVLAGMLSLISGGYMQAAEVAAVESEKAVSKVKPLEVNEKFYREFRKYIDAANVEDVRCLLVDKNANPNCSFSEGSAIPLHAVIMNQLRCPFASDEGRRLSQIFDLLVAHGADINWNKNPLGYSLLELVFDNCGAGAPRNIHYAVINQLLKAGLKQVSYDASLVVDIYSPKLARLFVYNSDRLAIPEIWKKLGASEAYIDACREDCDTLKEIRALVKGGAKKSDIDLRTEMSGVDKDPVANAFRNEAVLFILNPNLRKLAITYLIGDTAEEQLKALEESMKLRFPDVKD